MAIPLPILGSNAPRIPLLHLEQIWLQVGGTQSNLSCHHCFVSCHPHNDELGFLTLEDVRQRLNESLSLGVKEYYFTGGEPFLNPEMPAILALTLEYGPATVLTNGTILHDEWLHRLRSAEDASPYSLEFRVSIDGYSAEMNDPIRGPGTFERAMKGVRKLLDHGFLPIVTAACMNDSDESEMVTGFLKALREIGYGRPRIKILPPLRLGVEVQRCRGYSADECVTKEMMVGFDQSTLLCSHSRIVTDRGV